jgi:hypothetical protein
MTAQWVPRRPSPTFANIGKPLGDVISAPTREAAELLAVARYGRPVIVERIVRAKPQRRVPR